MKTKILTFLFLLSFSFIFSQQKVALQSNGTTIMFGGSNPFSDAYAAAVDNDIIYLPGATMPGFTIDKSITIIGAGHYPSATVATNPTKITGNISISENADGLHLEGIEFTGSITFTNNHKVDDVTIKRCMLLSGISYSGTGVTPCMNNSIEESVIKGNLTMTNLSYSVVTNSILEGSLYNGSNIGISNNLITFNTTSVYFLSNVDNSLFSNNIFFKQSNSYFEGGCDLNTFSNNIFAMTPPVGNNNYLNNYFNTTISTLFVNQTGYVFNYVHDYHLNSPTSYLGTDGNQVGIYGGIFPYKNEAIPHNPHIVSKTIGAQTNTAGELPVQITVEAQNN